MARLWVHLKNRKFIPLFSLMALLLSGGLALANGPVVLGGNIPVPLAPVQNGDLVIAQNLRQALQNNQLSTADRASLQTKLALSERASVRPTPEVVNNLPPVVLPTVPLPTFPANAQTIMLPDQEKIMKGSEGLVHAWEASTENTWQGWRNGIFYEVVAGAAADDLTQGWIKVFETSQSHSNQQVFLTSFKTGALRILQVQGERVIFADTSGGTLSFNLTSHTFEP